MLSNVWVATIVILGLFSFYNQIKFLVLNEELPKRVSGKSDNIKFVIYLLLSVIGAFLVFTNPSLIIIFYETHLILISIGYWVILNHMSQTINVTKNGIIISMIVTLFVIVSGLFYLF